MSIDYQETRSNLRVPPSNIDAEESVLGAAMLSADAANNVMDRLQPSDFYKPAHQGIFEAIAELFDGISQSMSSPCPTLCGAVTSLSG